MRNKGFYIKSVIATGEGMVISRVDFKDGCNLLFGPSEMGKSSVFSLIDFMLGKKEPPKLPPEGKGYDTFYMEFVTHEDNAVHTAKRMLDKKSVTIKDCPYEKFNNTAIIGTTYPFQGKETTYSQYLMGLNGFEEELQLKKSTTSKASFTYSWIRHLILADENRIVSETPIFNPQGQNTAVTQEKSVIYYLTTGEDDSAFVEQEKPEQRKFRYDGMIEVTWENIDAINARIRELGDVNYADLNDSNAVNELHQKIADEELRLKQLYVKREGLEEEKRKTESKWLFVREFIKRMEMLQKHYQTDMSRYEYLFESANLFGLLTETHVCPVCKSEIKENTQFDKEYLSSIQSEYNQVQLKITDIKDLIEKKKGEYSKLDKQINKIKSDLAIVENEISNFGFQLISFKNTLERYQKNIELKAEAKFLQEEAQRLYKKLDELKKGKNEKSITKDYNRETSIDEEFCNMVKEKLVYWNVIGENDPVVFDENGFDFVIGGKKRLTCGKGARGVTCSAILMTLLEFCQLKDIPFSNVLVLDSPITAHFTDGKVPVEETTQSQFFKYCNERINDYQLIIIDNKSPKSNERENLSNINFIEFSKDGRNGFYLGKIENN